MTSEGREAVEELLRRQREALRDGPPHLPVQPSPIRAIDSIREVPTLSAQQKLDVLAKEREIIEELVRRVREAPRASPMRPPTQPNPAHAINPIREVPTLSEKQKLVVLAKEREMIEELIRRERNSLRASPPLQPKTIHYTELPEMVAESRIAGEWNLYRQQVGGLLAEGQDGRWVLIKGKEIVGIWDTEKEAIACRVQRFPMDDVLIQQIQEWDHVYRCGAYYRPCPGTLTFEF